MKKRERIVLGSNLPLGFGGVLVSVYAPIAYPEYAKLGMWIGVTMLVLGAAGTLWAIFHKGAEAMSDDQPTTMGLKIEHDGDGPAMEINSGAVERVWP